MEGKIKEEVIDGKDVSPPPEHAGATASRRLKAMKSPGSVDGDTPPPVATPPATSPPGVSTSPPNRPTVAKLKRFLSTLVQFGTEMSPELGERVRSLVLSLAAGSTTIEEFHSSLQETTNFPLRPFVLPFLRSHLPLLQRELAAQARVAKQPVSQYLRHHEQLVLDPACSPSEPSEIFHSEMTSDGKRKHPESIYENGTKDEGEPAAKRPMPNMLFNPLAPLSLHPGLTQYQGLLTSGLPLLGGLALNSLPQTVPPPNLLPGGEPTPKPDVDEEWKNINTMLNCILSMVEKTKRALSILQSRDRSVAESDLKRAANEIVRLAEDRVGEIKRRADEAIAEVKRQAMFELERLVLRNVNGRNRDDDEEAGTSNHNICWNCGRKAQETCSGCNVARYCGALCQHRDWENHHQLCCNLDRRNSQLATNRLEERRPFAEDQRRHSTDENRRHKDDDKSKEKDDKERRMPGIGLLSTLRKDEGGFVSLRAAGPRALRANTPISATAPDK